MLSDGLFVIRFALYCLLWVFAVTLLGLTGARMHYTEHISSTNPLNGGHRFHDPVIAELLATSILVLLWSTFAIVVMIRQAYSSICTYALESIALSMLFTMWLTGTAIATTNLRWCLQHSPCSTPSSVVGIAWTGWIFLFFLFCSNLIPAYVNRAWTEPIHRLS